MRRCDRSALVGREAELRVLEQSLAGPRSGEAMVVAVVGEPGIGKTRLLRTFRERAADADFAVLSGAGSELEQEVPFGLVIDALDEPLGALGSSVLGRLGDERLAELGMVLPSLASAGGGLGTTSETERYRCHQAVRLALEEMTRTQPLVLVLDDVHWADPASAELVAYLLRHAVPRSLLVLAYRPNQAPRQLVRTLVGVPEEALHSLELAPLSIEQAAALLGETLDAPGLQALYRESGGIPLYLEQLARAGDGRSRLVLPGGVAAPAGSEIPSRVREGISQELELLSAPARRLIQAAAVAGESFELGLAVEIAELGEADANAAIDELTVADLLRPTDLPHQLSFRHPIVRRAVYDQVGHGFRLGAHRRAATGLARRGAPVGVRANHVEHSAMHGDQEAIALLSEAGRSAALRAPAAAARWFQAAVRLVPDDASTEQRLPLLSALATALATVGRLEEARAVLEQTLDQLHPDDAEGRTRLIAMIARIEQGLGRGDVARTLLVEALEAAAPSTPEAIALQVEVAKNHLMLREWDEAVSTANAATALAEDLGDQGLSLSAIAATALAAQFAGIPQVQAESVTNRAIAIVDGLPDDLVTSVLDALPNLLYAELALLNWRTAERHAKRGLRLSRANGQGHLFIDCMIVQSVAHMFLGRLGNAREDAELAVEASLLLENDQTLALTQGVCAWVTAIHGDFPVAIALGKSAAQAADRAPHSMFAWTARVSYGAALVEAGEPRLGRDMMHMAGGHELSDVPPTSRPHYHRILAQAELALGRTGAAEAVTELAEAGAERTGGAMRRGDAKFARASVLLAKGEPVRAATTALACAAAYDASETLIEAARARLIAGRAFALVGDAAGAKRELKRAYATLSECDAARLADQAAKELRGLGERVPGRRRGGTAPVSSGLTGREWEIAELVARGQTNRQIAEALYLSPKTVEGHLTTIFTKLDIPSRAAVAAAITRTEH